MSKENESLPRRRARPGHGSKEEHRRERDEDCDRPGLRKVVERTWYFRDDDCDDGLNAGRQEREDDPSAPAFLVGDEIGGNDCFAMPGTDGMEDAIEERDAEQVPHCGSVILARPNEAGH